MHTEPTDTEGPNLFATAKELNLEDTVFFSRERIDFDKMNILYNVSDFCISLSFAEGFGLSTLESMMTGTPIIAPTTGGLTRQVVDHRDQSENGVALPIEFKSLVGSQGVPYIYEDYVSCESAAKGIMKLFNLSDFERDMLNEKVLKYAREEFSYQKTVDLWHDSMIQAIENFKNYKKWERITF
jgi:glycosyltransferase involved in cell wall biosynthesis